MKNYYYADGKEQKGPFTLDELKELNITKETKVWYEGMAKWGKAGEIESLSSLFNRLPPPIDDESIEPPPIDSKSKRIKIIIISTFFILIVIAAYIGIHKWQGYRLYNQGMDSLKKSGQIDSTLFFSSANKGCTSAYYYVGKLYFDKKDTANAEVFFRKCEDNGGDRGLWLIEKDTVKRKEMAKKLFEKLSISANKGDWLAQYRLATFIERGSGTKIDYYQASKWYYKSSTQGCTMATVGLGNIYYNGLGVDKSYKKALKHFLLALDRGYIDKDGTVSLKLGEIYSDSLKEYSTAFKYFQLASEKNKDYFTLVALAYFNGKGVEKDFKKAFSNMKIAADNGSSLAQYFLALFYNKGIGIDKNLSEFEKLLTSSAAKGNLDAKDLLESYKRQKGSSSSISSSNVNCYYCGRTVDKQNSYVFGLGLENAYSYPVIIDRIRMGKAAGMAQTDLNALSACINYGKYFCSRRCVIMAGHNIGD